MTFGNAMTEYRFQHDPIRSKEVRRQDQHPIDDVIDVRQRKLRLMLLGEIEELPNNLLHTPHAILHRHPIFLLPARRQRPLP